MLDAMACGAPSWAPPHRPVQEVIQDGVNGRLTDFFNPEAIAENLAAMLADPEAQAPLKAAARRHVETHYDLHKICLPRQMALLDAIANGQPAPSFHG